MTPELTHDDNGKEWEAIPFTDHKGIFKWALFEPNTAPQRIQWNGTTWELHRPWGSNYYLPAPQPNLPGTPDDPVKLGNPDGTLDDLASNVAYHQKRAEQDRLSIKEERQ